MPKIKLEFSGSMDDWEEFLALFILGPDEDEIQKGGYYCSLCASSGIITKMESYNVGDKTIFRCPKCDKVIEEKNA